MSRVFGLLVEARGKLYENGILATQRLSHPVISVGNLTAGGTGKTPLTILLAETFRDLGFRPIVLSRGYRRRSSGIVVVSSGSGPLVSWKDAGDEPFLIARRAVGVSVLVGADRYAAGRLAEEQKLGNLFILDDGFQHRQLFRNVDLVTIDPEEWAGGERLYPSGRWREPASAIRRAHAAVIQTPGPAVGNLPIPSFTVRTVPDGVYRGSEAIPIESLKNQPVTAFAGIAKPDRFFRAVEELGINVTRKLRFRDHHAYTPHDIGELGTGNKLTTEKDAIKLEGEKDILHLRVSAQMDGVDSLLTLIRERLTP
jgi:tetraacyldisaccharide 4'-kinase